MSWLRTTLAGLLLIGHASLLAQEPPTPAPPSAEPPPLQQSFDALGTLLNTLPDVSFLSGFAAARARLALTRLLSLSANWPAQSPADYRANLDRNVRALEAALASTDAARLGALLQALADDLEIKLEHCDQSGGRLGGSVVVQVRTVNGDQESRNWQVFYLPRVLEAAGIDAANRFPQLSSPTEESLVPGRYVMWARAASGEQAGEATIVKVGEGRETLRLDLLVPAAPSR